MINAINFLLFCRQLLVSAGRKKSGESKETRNMQDGYQAEFRGIRA
jgi:hypothetical protein